MLTALLWRRISSCDIFDEIVFLKVSAIPRTQSIILSNFPFSGKCYFHEKHAVRGAGAIGSEKSTLKIDDFSNNRTSN